jgi:flagella basal body P-ring formation protein FlgA
MQFHCAHAEVNLTLKDQVVVTARGVRLSDIAAASGQAGGATAEDIEIVSAPRAGVVAYLRRADVELALRAHAATREAIRWSGAEVVAIRSSTQTLKGKTLAQAAAAAVRQQLQARFPGVVARAAGETADVDVRQGRFELVARPLALAALRPREAVWIDIVGDAGVERSVVVPVQVSLPAQGFAATRDLGAGEVLTKADVRPCEVDLAASAGVALTAEEVIGGRTRRAVKTGELLGKRSLAARGGVLRGDMVQVNMVAGTLRIDSSGVAQADASPAERIWVRMTNGTTLEARVVGDGKVAIE